MRRNGTKRRLLSRRFERQHALLAVAVRFFIRHRPASGWFGSFTTFMIPLESGLGKSRRDIKVWADLSESEGTGMEESIWEM